MTLLQVLPDSANAAGHEGLGDGDEGSILEIMAGFSEVTLGLRSASYGYVGIWLLTSLRLEVGCVW